MSRPGDVTRMTLLARFDGECLICEGAIRADEDRIVEIDGEWYHEECAEDFEEDR